MNRMVLPSLPPGWPPVLQLADQLHQLLREEGLQPGDRFLTAREAAKKLQIRQDLANKALQILVHRGVLIRKQRVGSIVAAGSSVPPELESIHILVQEDHLASELGHAAEVQLGLHSELPGCTVDAQVVPTGGATEFIDDVVRRAMRAPAPAGLVLVRGDYLTQRQVQACGLPAVIHGSTYPGIDLSSIDTDCRQMGRLQAEELTSRGARRLILFRKDRTVPGEREFFRGFQEGAAKAGLRADEVELVELVPNQELVAAEVRRVLEEGSGVGVQGMVCATEILADAAWKALEDAGEVPGETFLLHANRAAPGSGSTPPYPFLRPIVSPREQGALLARALRQRLGAPDERPVHRRYSVELVTPGPGFTHRSK